MDEIKSIIGSTRAVLWDIAAYAPRVVVALVVLFIGWLLAKLIKRLVIRVLRFMRMEDAAERIGIDSFLLQGQVRYTSVTLVGEILYWFLIFSVMLLALNFLGMTEASQIFSRIMNYIPKVFIGMVILIFGTLMARFTHAVMFAYLDNIGIASAHILSSIGQYAILIFVVFVAIEQFAVAGELLQTIFEIAFGALGLAFGLAFGLGGREVAKNLLDKALNSQTRNRK